MPLTYVLEVNAPVEVAFALVDDKENLKLWMDGLEDTIYTSPYDASNPVGAKFIQKIREGGRVNEYEGEVTAYEKYKHLGVKIGSKHFTVQVDYRFMPIPTGTRLDYSADISMSSVIAKIMGFCFGWLSKMILRKQMRKFKEVAERSVSNPSVLAQPA